MQKRCSLLDCTLVRRLPIGVPSVVHVNIGNRARTENEPCNQRWYPPDPREVQRIPCGFERGPQADVAQALRTKAAVALRYSRASWEELSVEYDKECNGVLYHFTPTTQLCQVTWMRIETFFQCN